MRRGRKLYKNIYLLIKNTIFFIAFALFFIITQAPSTKAQTANKCGERPDLAALFANREATNNNATRQAKSAELSPLFLLNAQQQIQFNEFRLQSVDPSIDSTNVTKLHKDPTLVVQKRDHIDPAFTFSHVMATLADSVNQATDNQGKQVDGLRLFQDWWRTFLPFSRVDASNPNSNPFGCDPNNGRRQTSKEIKTTINGFPYTCSRAEGKLSELTSLTQISESNKKEPFEIVSLVNRGDLLSIGQQSQDIRSCGEYRIVVRAACGAKGDEKWCEALGLDEAQIYASFEFEPTINSYKQIGGSTVEKRQICKTVQQFWRGLGGQKEEIIQKNLYNFFFEGVTIPIEGSLNSLQTPKIIDAKNLGLQVNNDATLSGLGQLRTNISTHPRHNWVFREYAFRTFQNSARLMPVSLRGNIERELFKTQPENVNASCKNFDPLKDTVAKELCKVKNQLETNSIEELSQFKISDNCINPGELQSQNEPRFINDDLIKILSRSQPSIADFRELKSRVTRNFNFRSCTGCHTAGGAAEGPLKHLKSQLAHDYPSSKTVHWNGPEFVHSIDKSTADERRLGSKGSQIMEKLFLPLRCTAIQLLLNDQPFNDPFNCIMAED